MRNSNSREGGLRHVFYGMLALVVCVVAASTAVASMAVARTANKSSRSGTTAAGIPAARAAVKLYSKPTGFPVNRPLLKRPRRKFGYLDCAEPTCGVLIPLFDLAAKTMHVPAPFVVQAGGSASDLQSALSTILADKPAALILPAVNLGDLGNSIAQYKSAGVPISAGGIMAGPAQGIGSSLPGRNNFKLEGKILAAWAVAKVGAHANIAWYYTPELDFSPVMTAAFKAALSKYCRSCTMRSVPIPAAEDGSTAPSAIVSDLKANTSTNVAVFANLETAIGLPAALKVAGIKIPIAGGSPLPQSVQDMKSGYIEAAVTFDYGVLAFTDMDAAARLATHEPLTHAEASGVLQTQLITKANLNGKHLVAGLYSPTPDYVKVFAKLWAHAKPTG